MRKLAAFIQVTLDGYFTAPDGDISWAHNADPEWTEFTSGNADGSNGPMLFGRVTYEMMASFWPTAAAREQMPRVADGMNTRPKFVVSRTLKEAPWQNTSILRGDLATEVRRLKQEAAEDITILGSGSVIAQLTEAHLIDDYQLVVVPVVLGAGRTPFEGVTGKPTLKLMHTRSFKNGNVVLSYGT